jgi:hypothetical protein
LELGLIVSIPRRTPSPQTKAEFSCINLCGGYAVAKKVNFLAGYTVCDAISIKISTPPFRRWVSRPRCQCASFYCPARNTVFTTGIGEDVPPVIADVDVGGHMDVDSMVYAEVGNIITERTAVLGPMLMYYWYNI